MARCPGCACLLGAGHGWGTPACSAFAAEVGRRRTGLGSSQQVALLISCIFTLRSWYDIKGVYRKAAVALRTDDARTSFAIVVV